MIDSYSIDNEPAIHCHQDCLTILFQIIKSCHQNEETIRLCSQILRVIASGEPALLNNSSTFFDYLDLIFNIYPHSTTILLHLFCCLLHLIRNPGNSYSLFFLLLDHPCNIMDVYKTHIIRVIAGVFQYQRESRLLRLSFLLLHELLHSIPDSRILILSSYQIAHKSIVIKEINENQIISLSILVIQFISVDSNTLISALEFLYTCCHYCIIPLILFNSFL